jgi:hypothetical protein
LNSLPDESKNKKAHSIEWALIKIGFDYARKKAHSECVQVRHQPTRALTPGFKGFLNV